MHGLERIRAAILAETLPEDGFLGLLRTDRVSEARFAALMSAIESANEASRGAASVDRGIVAALFEVPWEVENCVEHYARRDPALGRRVSKMADALRVAINDFLWDGLERLYR